MNQSLRYLMLVGLTGVLAACGGSGESGSARQTGSISVGLTDAPVDSALEVNIEVTALVLQPSNGERNRFELQFPQPINLLELQGGAFETLITDEVVPAGRYNWMRIELGENNTVVIDNESGTGTYPLTTPSARGVQTSGFTVPAGGKVSFTIDFDVRKSLVNPVGQDGYRLKPVLRLVDNSEVGTIAGTVAGELIAQECGDALTPEFAGNVYVHEGAGVEPDDIGSETEPLVVAPVEENGTYTAGFIPADDYTVSYTCGDDMVENDQGEPSDDDINFTGAKTITVVANDITTADFEIQVQQ